MTTGMMTALSRMMKVFSVVKELYLCCRKSSLLDMACLGWRSLTPLHMHVCVYELLNELLMV